LAGNEAGHESLRLAIGKLEGKLPQRQFLKLVKMELEFELDNKPFLYPGKQKSIIVESTAQHCPVSSSTRSEKATFQTKEREDQSGLE
jgi:hypothetical protein